MKTLPIVFILPILSSLSGCAYTGPVTREAKTAPSVKSTLRRFHHWPTNLVQPSFSIVAYDTNTIGSLSAQAYQGHVVACLTDKGWRHTNGLNGDVIVAIRYGLVAAADYDQTRTVPEYGSVGGGTRYVQGWTYGATGPQWSYGYAQESPRFGVTGYRTRTTTRTLHLWRVHLDIYSLQPVTMLYESQLQAVDSTPHSMLKLIPGMFNELLRDFPGESPKEIETKAQLAELRPAKAELSSHPVPPVNPVQK